MKVRIVFFVILFLSASCIEKEKQSPIPYYEKGKWGFMDIEKNIVLSARYDDVNPFQEGLAAVQMNKKWGYIDRKGEEVISPVTYDFAGDFSEGLAVICSGNKFGYIDNNGKIIIELKYDYTEAFADGLAKVFQNHRCGFINLSGKEVIPVKYDYLGNFYNQTVLAGLNNRWTFISMDGKEKMELPYDSVWITCEPRFYKVCKDGKYGFINREGEEQVLLKYDEITGCGPDLYIAKKSGKMGLLNRYGREVFPFRHETIRAIDAVSFIGETIDGEIEIIHANGIVMPDHPFLNELGVKESNPKGFITGKYMDQRDGEVYPLVTIGSQTWMTKNLRFDASGSKCPDVNEAKDCETYGRYYPWNIALNACPEGWRVPALKDWEHLISYLGGSKMAYGQVLMGGESGLNVPLGGYYYNPGSFEDVGESGYFWTASTVNSSESACVWINPYEGSIVNFGSNRMHYRNVRCIKE